MNARSGWIIDVCGTCHRLAVWPFCEHRSDTGRWTVAVPVVPTQAGKSVLARAHSDRSEGKQASR